MTAGNDQIRLDGQVAIITGAGRGLGRAYALELARRGARIVVCDIGGTGPGETPWAQAVTAEIAALGGTAVPSHDSVASAAGGEAVVQTALEAFGSVDILVNNAGFMRSAVMEDMTPQQLEDVVGVHLLAGFHVTRPAWKVMIGKGYGRVVLTASHAIFGYEGNTNYASSKAGLLGLARSLALEGARHGILVNCVLPSAVSQISAENKNTAAGQSSVDRAISILNVRRTAESVAPMVALLASNACPVNGEAFSCLAGSFARVFFGMTEGWAIPSVDGLTAEEIAEHMNEIRDLRTVDAPASMVHVFETAARLVAGVTPPVR